MYITELRIGNYVKLYSNVAQIQRSDFSLTEHGIAIYEGKPIPLTEEWLFKFSFKKSEKARGITYYFANTASDWKIVERNGIFKRNGKTINYVHQLQNLYFILTDTELQISNSNQ